MPVQSNATWHPCTQMKDHEICQPLDVVSAHGAYIKLADGRELFDGISSWWCKSLGHKHPRLQRALVDQMERFEHVMLAGTTNDVIKQLSAKLASYTQTLNKVFYAGDGSCAVEVALKMSLHAHQLSGQPQRTKFMALRHAYHGETAGAMSISDLGIYRAAYEALTFPVHFLAPLPDVSGEDDPLWHDCSLQWQQMLPQLEAQKDEVAAIIVEPIVQGAGGMKIYSADFLRRLRAWTQAYGIHLIADEIMTGVGRTGKMFACEHAGIEPDFMCLSKGLTSGWMPFSATLTNQSIYDLFYDDYEKGKSFLHSHTYSGHALAASVALEVLNIVEEEKLITKAQQMSATMVALFSDIAQQTARLTNIRSIGAVAAADITGLAKTQRISLDVFKHAAELGVFLRPLGHTIYWLPPLIANENDLLHLADVTNKTIHKIF